MNFSTSSQFKNWLFTAEQLSSIRIQLRENVLLSSSTNGSASASAETLTQEEEQILLKYYEKNIIRFCQQKNFSPRVQGAALMYFKRFYLRNSMLNSDPSKLFITCVYIACKVEEEYCSAEALIKDVPSLTLQQIKKAELKLLKGLNYELIVHLPFTYVDGITEDISRRVQKGHFEETGLQSLQELSAIRRSAFNAVQCLLETDAPLLFDPGKLALAAVRSGYKSCKKKLEPYIDAVIQKDGCDMETLRRCLKDIDTLGVEGSKEFSVKMQDVQEIDRKLKLWIKANHRSKADADH